MKKIFYFILAAVTMTLAACGDGNDPAAKKFQFTVTKVNNTTVDVEIKALDENKYFICSYGNSAGVLSNPEELAQGVVDFTKSMFSGGFPGGLQQGQYSKRYDGLSSDIEYAFWACEVDKDYKIVGKVEYLLVKGGEVQGENGGENGGGNGGENGGGEVNNAPAAPIGVELAYYASSLYAEIVITWHSVEGATSYRVYRDPAYDVIRAEDGTLVYEERYKHVEETFFSEKMWLEYDYNYQYEYYVTAVKDGVESEPSEKVRFVYTPGL